ncbi:hypothetical protein B0H17DRAFT_1216814 [Mycena rosella]|uniref:Uncharacterized protein n=1 Tax=Mycena rosella TaxID=1033263 RepID=A0AAD7C3B4_MYCRO|nr:hypothetical protein B0H17DRAFT_1216814 [Mycena rosella]
MAHALPVAPLPAPPQYYGGVSPAPVTAQSFVFVNICADGPGLADCACAGAVAAPHDCGKDAWQMALSSALSSASLGRNATPTARRLLRPGSASDSDSNARAVPGCCFGIILHSDLNSARVRAPAFGKRLALLLGGQLDLNHLRPSNAVLGASRLFIRFVCLNTRPIHRVPRDLRAARIVHRPSRKVLLIIRTLERST